MKKYWLLFALASVLQLSYAQKFKPGKVDRSWFDIVLTEGQKKAPAVFLEKYRRTHFEYRDNLDGWTLFTTVHHVIKILDTDGLEYANHKIRVYQEGREDQKIDKIEAFSYNLAGSNVERDKIKGENIITNNITKRVKETSILIPAVKVGSIIEYSYRIESTYWHINDVIIQEEIPVRHMYQKIEIPQFFDYNTYVKGGLTIDPKLSIENRSENFTTEAKNPYGGKIANRTNFANIKYKETVAEYEFSNLLALKKEPFVNNLDNYRASVSYELAAVEFQLGKKAKRSKTWSEVATFFLENLEVGENLENVNFLKEDVQRIRESATGNNEKIQAAYALIQRNMTWDRNDNYLHIPKLKKAYQGGAGSAYEINLILVALLKELGLESSPILASTKDNGVPIYPTLSGFNYVLAGVLMEGKWLVLDATEENAPLGMLPERILNWEGRLIKENGQSQSIPLFSNKYAEQKSLVIATINSDGGVEGKIRKICTNNSKLDFVNNYKPLAKKAQLLRLNKDLLVENKKDLVFKFENKKKPASISFSFQDDTFTEIIDTKMYVKPLLFLNKKENPLKSETREYPIDFRYPTSTENIVTINIPEGYKIKSIPTDIEISLPKQMGEYKYTCKRGNGNSVQTLSTLTMNKTLVAPEFYQEIKEFYAKMIAKEKETIVLEKI